MVSVECFTADIEPYGRAFDAGYGKAGTVYGYAVAGFHLICQFTQFNIKPHSVGCFCRRTDRAN